MADEKAVAPVMVKLKTATSGKDSKDKTRNFDEQTALKLLTLPKAQWKLADEGYTFNGKELKKKSK